MTFLPLVSSSCAFGCELAVIFLRKEPAGALNQGGDLDNHVKTLLDGLSVLKPEQILKARMSRSQCIVSSTTIVLSVRIGRLSAARYQQIRSPTDH